MNYYTEFLPVTLAEKLKEKGMPIVYHPLFTPECEGADQSVGLIRPSYAETFDWLMEKGIYTRIIPFREVKGANGTLWAWSWFINKLTQPSINSNNFWMNWHEAADAAIGKALTLI